jgi:hypothetical protein
MPRQSKAPQAFILRTLESVRREIDQIERKFHRTIKSAQTGTKSAQTGTARRAHKTSTARTRAANGSPGSA